MTPTTLKGEVVGYRVWEIDDDLNLMSLALRNHAWTPGINEAKCTPPMQAHFHSSYPPILGEEHTAPDPKCGCGLYAMHSVEDAETYYGEPRVLGLVIAWGNVEVHATGLRASHARVGALLCDGSLKQQAIVRAVAQKYRVPVVKTNEMLQLVAREHGEPVPEDMRPELRLDFASFSRAGQAWASHFHAMAQRMAQVGIAADRLSAIDRLRREREREKLRTFASRYGMIGPGVGQLPSLAPYAKNDVRITVEMLKAAGSLSSLAPGNHDLKVVSVDPMTGVVTCELIDHKTEEGHRPMTPVERIKARKQANRYDPSAFTPKRKGGRR